MLWKLPVLLALATLVACGTAPSPGDPAAAGRDKVTFFDSQIFDRRLSSALSARGDTVSVEVTDRVSLKELPERLDRWLVAVDQQGGKVSVVSADPAQDGQTRSIAALIGVVMSLYSKAGEVQKDLMYRSAGSYDATVRYRTDANGNRVVEEILFSRRRP